jgi:hypothetical protein
MFSTHSQEGYPWILYYLFLWRYIKRELTVLGSIWLSSTANNKARHWASSTQFSTSQYPSWSKPINPFSFFNAATFQQVVPQKLWMNCRFCTQSYIYGPLPSPWAPPPQFMVWGWVHLVLRPLFGLLYQPRMIDDDDDCGTTGGMRICTRNRSTR